MKKLFLTVGGHKIHNQDWLHAQNAVIEATQALSHGLGGDVNLAKPIIITGVVPTFDTGNKWTWTTGFIFWSGELYEVPVQAVSLDVTTNNFEVVETLLSGNPVTYKDASSVNVHLVRKLQPTTGAGEFSAQEILDTAENRLEHRLGVKLANTIALDKLNEHGWTSSGIVITDGQTTEDRTLQYRVIGNKVEFRGRLRKASGSYGDILTLPAVATPALTVIKSLEIGTTNGAGLVHGGIRFAGGGVVAIASDASPASTDLISFDGITYQKD